MHNQGTQMDGSWNINSFQEYQTKTNVKEHPTKVIDLPKCTLSPKTSSGTTNSEDSADRKTRLSKYLWVELTEQLRTDRQQRRMLLDNLELLNVSEEVFNRIKLPQGDLRTLVERFGNQNCIRALSVLYDLTAVKKNQYKFMFEKLSLTKAVDVLISESCFLFKSLQKHNTAKKHFIRLLRSWIDYIFIVHKVPEDAKDPLTFNIIQQIELTNGVTLQ